MTVHDLTKDLFRMPDRSHPGYVDTCPGCAARGNQPIAAHNIDGRTIRCAYTCHACSWEWECAWWEGGKT